MLNIILISICVILIAISSYHVFIKWHQHDKNLMYIVDNDETLVLSAITLSSIIIESTNFYQYYSSIPSSLPGANQAKLETLGIFLIGIILTFIIADVAIHIFEHCGLLKAWQNMFTNHQQNNNQNQK